LIPNLVVPIVVVVVDDDDDYDDDDDDDEIGKGEKKNVKQRFLGH
jgi:hypothetical protein